MKKSFLLSAFACLALYLPACDGGKSNDGEDDADDGEDNNDDSGADDATGEEDEDEGSGGSESGGSGDDSGGVIVPPDTGGDVECDIWAQDCPEGSKCMPWADDGGNSWNAVKCTPLAEDPKEVGDTCTVEGSGVSGIDDCVEGAMCWEVDPTTNMGVCNAMCIGSQAEPACEDDSRVCSISNNGSLILCLPGCDPLLQDCEGDNLCLLAFSETGFLCVIDASTEGEGNPGDACEFANVCQPGNTCISGMLVPGCTTDYCCTEYCDATAANSCALMADGAQCVPIWDEGEGPPDWGHIGYCQLPM